MRRTLFLSAALTLLSACNWTELVSVSSTGEQANDHTDYRSSVSDDGRYVAFISKASNLVPGDTNAAYDVFVRDNIAGTTTRVSVDSTGTQSNGDSGVSEGEVSISGNGRHVAFSSNASNLVSGDTNNLKDIFVHDRNTGNTTRVSVDSAGHEANDKSFNPKISANGRYVAFSSDASNLVVGDTNNADDGFVHDRVTGITTRISLSSAGAEGNDRSYSASISGDGRFVAFHSLASNLVPGDTNGTFDAFVRDRQTGTTERVSLDHSGQQVEGSNVIRPSISGSGRYVAFMGSSNEYVEGDSNCCGDIFVHDRETGTITRASLDSSGAESNGWSHDPTLSWDGRYVAFESRASNLVVGDTNNSSDIFVHDRVTGRTTRVSVDSSGQQATGGNNGDSEGAVISADGRYVAFGSDTINLVPYDDNGEQDIVIRAVHEVTVGSMLPDLLPIGETTAVTITGTNFLPDATLLLGEAQVDNLVVVDESTITADVTVPAGMADGQQDVTVTLPGTGPGTMAGSAGTCTDCAAFIVVNCGCGCP